MRPVFLLCFLLIREGISMLDILGIREIYLPPSPKKINILCILILEIFKHNVWSTTWSGCLVFTAGICFVNSLPYFAINPALRPINDHFDINLSTRTKKILFSHPPTEIVS